MTTPSAPPASPRERRAALLLLALALMVGVGLRLWHLDQGLRYDTYHPDAKKQIAAVERFLAGEHTFDLAYLGVSGMTAYVGYPYFTMRIVAGVVTVADGAGLDLLAPTEGLDRTARIARVARGLNVLFAVATMLLLYGALSATGAPLAGGIAAFLMATSLVFNQTAKYVGADLPMAAFAAAALYFTLLNERGERRRNYALAGLFVGLATATKYNGALMALFMIFHFWRLHPTFGEWRRHGGSVAVAVAAATLAFVAATPNLWGDPARGVEALRVAGSYSANYRMKGTGLLVKLAFLRDEWPYHLWTLKESLTPLPWIVPLLTTGWLATGGRRTAWLWGTPLLIFILGKLTMPISGPSHYLVPLLFVFAGIGVAIRRGLALPVAARAGTMVAATALALFALYDVVEDTSLWRVPPAKREMKRYSDANFGVGETARALLDFTYEETRREGALVQRFGDGADRPATLHRGRTRLITVIPPYRPVAAPRTSWIDPAADRVIYTDGLDYAVSARAFLTGAGGEVSRLYVGGRLPDEAAVWVKNVADVRNTVSLTLGGRSFSRTLAPHETAPLERLAPVGRSLLYSHRAVALTARSTAEAAWVVATTPATMADLPLPPGACASGAKDWRARAGYPASLIADKMTRPLPPPGEPLALMKGFYRIEATGDGPLTVEVRQGERLLARGEGDGQIALDLTVDAPLAWPVGIRATGGATGTIAIRFEADPPCGSAGAGGGGVELP